MTEAQAWKTLVHPDEALLILGSLHAFPQDRRLDRSEVRPVQAIVDGDLRLVPFFDSWGEWGVISLAWHPSQPAVLYVATETEVMKVDVAERRVVNLGIPNLHDLHEINVIGDTLWLANTGRDEVVAFDVVDERVSERVSLAAYGSRLEITSRVEEDGGDDRQLAGDVREVEEKFHCNQVFRGFDGDPYALVHYVSGDSRFIRRAARKVRGQGNGGVINLATGRGISLGLKGPHTVRKVGGDYWVCDSGRSSINVYDGSWTRKGTVPSKGWVRGASVSESLGVYYVGISRFRKRYLVLNPSVQQTPNMVQAISVETGKPLQELVLPGIERITNVYVVPKEVALAMLELRQAQAVER